MRTELKRTCRVAVKDSLTALRRPRAKARFRHAVTSIRGPLRLHIGAGAIKIGGWVNSDATWRNALYLDVTKPWPVPSGSVSDVYGDNVIEHFPLAVGRRVLANCFDALAPGGVLRLATPDVERTARLYLEDAAMARQHMAFLADYGFAVDHPVDLLRVTFAECGHHEGYLYDYASLADELARAGFVGIRRVETGRSDVPALAGLETRDNETCAATQLVVEAVKPEV